MNYKLSICLPAFRTHLWEDFYKSIPASIGDKYSWEVVMVGPNDPPPFFDDKKNFKFLKDYGCPSRCAQLATAIAEGELFVSGVDDGLFTEGSLATCIEMMDNLTRKDVVAVRYVEGPNRENDPIHFRPEYWNAHHHPTLRVCPPDYKIILLGMFNLEYFREIGGWDCEFEALNMNYHDLAFRIQNDGGEIHISPDFVHYLDWSYAYTEEYAPIKEAFETHDLKLFQDMYATWQPDRIKIDYHNWAKQPAVWDRRFGHLK